jgi:glycosyltransferase involved in cell wall biosynthesis
MPPRHSGEGPRGDITPPLVSVIVPAYNAAPYIVEALDSVFAQTFRSYEVIVVNDGSPDTSDLEIALRPYRESVVYIHQTNRGPGGARNAGIAQALGDYVAFLDADDSWLPEYLTEQLRVLRGNPAFDIVYADAVIVGRSGTDGRTFMQNNPSQGPVTFEALLRWECHLITSCVVARRRTLIDAGLFDEQYRHAEDFDLWLRVAHRGGRITYQERVLARRRQTDGSLSMEMTRMNRSLVGILKKAAGTLDLSRSARDLLEAQIAECEAFADLEEGKQQLAGGQYRQASEALRRANTYYRTRTLSLVLLGLRVAPRLLGRAYNLRTRLLGRWLSLGGSRLAR